MSEMQPPWIERFTLWAIADCRFGVLPLMSFEMTTHERKAADLLRSRGLVRSWLGFWVATREGQEHLARFPR